MESVFKGQFIKASSIAKAQKIYGESLPESLKDVVNSVSMSFSNQIMEMYNVRGLFNLSKADFLKTDLVKKGLSTEALQVFQESGEHWIQAVTTMAVLDGIKVLNADGKFIDKNGKVVKDDKSAASLLDMYKKDKGGLVTLDPTVAYTTHSRLSKWNKGGKEKVASLIIKKIHDTVGNYRRVDQPDFMRNPIGQLFGLYRKYFIPMGQARLRNWETAFKSLDDLNEDDQRFSYALQENEEGTYVTFARYVMRSIKDKNNYLLFRSNWNKMTEYQRHNVKRATVEFVLAFVMLPLAQTALLALAGDDNDFAYFVLYQMRRLDTELSQYFDPQEAFKMLRSPIPSARLLETAGSIMTGVVAPWTWSETYEKGPNKGKSKLGVKIQKQIPVLKETIRTYEDLYDYQRSSVGTGL